VVRGAAKGEPWRAQGADVRVASLEDAGALSRALAGATGFFALLPEDPTIPDFHARQRRMADAMAAAVKESGVPHVVFLSATAACLPDGNGPAKDLHYAENALRATGATVTALRPTYFQDNVMSVLPAAREQGIYPNLLPSAEVSFPTVATRDIGRVAASCLVERPSTNEVIDILGPSYSVRQLASALGRALEKELRVLDVPASEQVRTLMETGMSQQAAEALAELFACFGAGRVSPRGDRLVSGTTTIDEVIAGYLRQ
jgi:uncharacterized protein YbjT (DUF2867 family)